MKKDGYFSESDPMEDSIDPGVQYESLRYGASRRCSDDLYNVRNDLYNMLSRSSSCEKDSEKCQTILNNIYTIEQCIKEVEAITEFIRKGE